MGGQKCKRMGASKLFLVLVEIRVDKWPGKLGVNAESFEWVGSAVTGFEQQSPPFSANRQPSSRRRISCFISFHFISRVGEVYVVDKESSKEPGRRKKRKEQERERVVLLYTSRFHAQSVEL